MRYVEEINDKMEDMGLSTRFRHAQDINEAVLTLLSEVLDKLEPCIKQICDAAGIDEICPVDHVTLYYAWNIHKMDGKPIKDFLTGEVIGYTNKVDCPHCQQELKKEGE